MNDTRGESSPVRFYLDSNVYDQLTEETQDRIRLLAETGRAKFYSTHVTEDELGAIPPEKAKKRAALTAVAEELAEDVHSIPMVWDFSPWDRSRWGDELSRAIYDALKPKHGPGDAIHVATADNIGCDYFVTEDKDLIEDIEALEIRMKAKSFDQMLGLLMAL